MNYYRIMSLWGLSLGLLVCLTGCLSTTGTVLPSLTFHQYAQSPVSFKTVNIKDTHLSPSSHEVEGKFRDQMSSYFNSRFQAHENASNHLNLDPLIVNVTKSYLKRGGKNDILSPWKSYDQYQFQTEIKINLGCDQNHSNREEVIRVSKTIKIPTHYSLYKRDLHLMGFTEDYVVDMDRAILGFLSTNCSSH